MLAKTLPHGIAWVPARELEHDCFPLKWSYDCLKGHLTEVSTESNGAALTFAFNLILQAQLAGEIVAWVAGDDHSFYPPDVTENGIDVCAMVVLRLPATRFLSKATDSLLRAGGIGLIIVDLGTQDVQTPMLMRLKGLVKKNNSTVTFLTQKTPEESSMGSLISFRGHIQRIREQQSWGWRMEILKDKRGAVGRVSQELCDGPPGLR